MRSLGPVGRERRRAVALWIAIFATVCAVASISLAGPKSSGKVVVCHATSSKKNPYVRISVDAASITRGGHGRSGVNKGDIIPPFDGYPGNNWDDAHIAIFVSECGPAPTTETTTSTTSNATSTSSSPSTTTEATSTTTGGTTTTFDETTSTTTADTLPSTSTVPQETTSTTTEGTTTTSG
jgi:hypothetical protein